MLARPTEKNKCRGCVSVYHDSCADTHVGAALDIPQDLREGFRVCSPKCWRLSCEAVVSPVGEGWYVPAVDKSLLE
jgi:hypothetical protein